MIQFSAVVGPNFTYSIVRQMYCYFFTRNDGISKTTGRTYRRNSWSGETVDRGLLKRGLSVPSLSIRWTCVRCLQLNNRSSMPNCIVCQTVSSPISIQASQIWTRKAKRPAVRKLENLHLDDKVNPTQLKCTTTSDAESDTHVLNVAFGAAFLPIDPDSINEGEEFYAYLKTSW